MASRRTAKRIGSWSRFAAGDPAVGGQRLAEPGQRRAHGVLGGKVLQDVRHEHAVEIAARQLGIGDAARHGPDARVPVLVAAAHVDRPPLSSGNRVDELAPARARIEDPGRPAGLAVQVDGDLRPDGLRSVWSTPLSR